MNGDEQALMFKSKEAKDERGLELSLKAIQMKYANYNLPSEQVSTERFR